jgi:hypothetical protein
VRDQIGTDAISKHFKQFLGADVNVSFAASAEILMVILHRHDRLPENFVQAAYQAFQKTNPVAAVEIGKLLVSYEIQAGRMSAAVPVN